MADNAAASQEDDLSLPRAAVNKMIKEMIPNIRISNDARELVLNCCTEFIHLIASESNEICNKQTKKTISPEHVISALDSLGFQDYVKDVESVYKQFKAQTQTRKMNNKMKNQGVPEEELLRQQQELFARAREQQAQEDWLHMQQQQQQAQQAQQQQAQQQRLTTGDPNAPQTQQIVQPVSTTTQPKIEQQQPQPPLNSAPPLTEPPPINSTIQTNFQQHLTHSAITNNSENNSMDYDSTTTNENASDT